MKIDIKKNKFARKIIILLGIFISAAGINLLLAPANLLSGGLAGIVVIISTLFKINQTVLFLLFNIPIFLICKKYVGKEFFYSSLINMAIFSLALGMTQDLSRYTDLNDIMLQCVFGGIVTGVGTGLIFKMNTSVGGLDIVAAALKIKYNISIKNCYLVINFFIILAGGLFFGIKPALYTMIAMYLTAVAMEITKDSFNKQYSITVISNNNQEIAEKIMKDLKRGVTLIDAEGAYTKTKKKIIYCIVDSSEVGRIKKIVYETDSNAFISINDTEEVKGGGFIGKLL